MRKSQLRRQTRSLWLFRGRTKEAPGVAAKELPAWLPSGGGTTKKLVILMGICVLATVGCEGGICVRPFGSAGGIVWDWDRRESDRSPKTCDLTGSWSGSVMEVTGERVEIFQHGTDLLIDAPSGYRAWGSNQDGTLVLTDRSGNEIFGSVLTENEIILPGADGHSATLTRVQQGKKSIKET